MTRQEALELYKIEQDKFNKTRDIQWKFNLAFWGLIAGGIVFFGKYKIDISEIIRCGMLSAFLLSHLLFTILIQGSLSSSNGRIINLLKGIAIHDDTANAVNIKIDSKIRPLRPILWVSFQILATGVLLFVLNEVLANARTL